MPDRTRKRPNEANALARWNNEGGAAKGAPQKARDDMTSLAKEEEHILRCLGAAVIMQWDDLPIAIQRELFEHAISMGKLHHTAELKVQIAQFLHKRSHGGPQVGDAKMAARRLDYRPLSLRGDRAATRSDQIAKPSRPKNFTKVSLNGPMQRVGC